MPDRILVCSWELGLGQAGMHILETFLQHMLEVLLHLVAAHNLTEGPSRIRTGGNAGRAAAAASAPLAAPHATPPLSDPATVLHTVARIIAAEVRTAPAGLQNSLGAHLRRAQPIPPAAIVAAAISACFWHRPSP